MTNNKEGSDNNRLVLFKKLEVDRFDANDHWIAIE